MGSKRPARREFLKSGAALAGGFTLGAAAPAIGQDTRHHSPPMIKEGKDQIAYGDRSPHVTSVRIAHGGRPSPDNWGLTFHVAAPLQDSVGVITPSSLHYMGTTRGSFLPDIDPREHRLMIHGMVDRPLTFTMDDLKRLPSVTRIHFIECAGNRSSRRAKTVQETHGMTSCAEWTGVLLSTLLKECGLKGGASWFVAEGAEEVKGASSMPIAKAMDDCIVAYGMNGEAVRPQQGFPVRLMVPGFEGIFHTKWLRRIKVVDRYYMNYNDFGHLDRDPKVAALDYQIGPKSVITFPSGGQQLPGRGFYEISGLAWSGGGAIKLVEVSTDGGKRWNKAEIKGTAQRMAHARFGYHVELGRTRDRAPVALHGRNRPGSTVARTDRQVLEQALRRDIQRAGSGQQHSAVEDRQRWERHQWLCLEFSRSRCSWAPPCWRSRRRTAWDARRPQRKSARGISPSVRPERNSRRGAEPSGRARSCIARRAARDATGRQAIDGKAPILKSKAGPNADVWARGRILPLRAPFATTVWDYINRAMPLNREGTLTADEVYALTAYLLFINDVIPEDEVLDAKSLPKVKMPIGDNYASPA